MRAGPPRAYWQPSPNSNSLSVRSDVPSDTCWQRDCRPGKTLGSFDFASVPMISHAHVTALASGDAWLKKGVNILLFGPSGSGKSHLGAALGHALVENGYRVLFTRTTDLVQRLQTARQSLFLESAIEKLDKYHLIILDDLCYVNRDQAETSALFRVDRFSLRTAQLVGNV